MIRALEWVFNKVASAAASLLILSTVAWWFRGTAEMQYVIDWFIERAGQISITSLVALIVSAVILAALKRS